MAGRGTRDADRSAGPLEAGSRELSSPSAGGGPPPPLPPSAPRPSPRSMTRRRVVAVASALSLLVLGLLAALAVVSVTQTSFGRERVRRLLMHYAARSSGKIYIGRLGGGLITGVTIDSLEIRGPDDSLFVATGRITVDYDPRDFLDRRILLSRVEVEHPVVHMRRHANGVWNWRQIFPEGKKGPPRTERGFGDFIVIDSAVVRDGTFTLTLPWSPDDSLRGARRDSAVAYNLGRRDREVRRTGDGLARTYRWTRLSYVSPYIRIADADSAGRYFGISRLDVREADPPFLFSNLRGGARQLGDSIWLDLQHFDLPGSTGSAKGKVVWGSDLPIRYAIDVAGDSVSLADVAWVYPTLPTTGGGRMKLRIANEPSRLSVIDYAIRDMDVRTTKSRLRGNMTFGVGGPVLIVKDVRMDAAPLDFDLIRALNGKPFPYDWQGQITGSVTARGGPLDRFRVDSSAFVFRDANVPGAVSAGSGKGELDILLPAFTAFHSFAVTAHQVDLRTLEFLNPNFPRLGGYVSGRAVLDSSWLDVRFRDADLTHVDGPGEATHMTGQGRVTYGEQFMTYDLDLDATPLSFTTLARSYPTLPLRGTVRGPLRVKGTIENLEVATTLTGTAGQVALNGRFDLFAPGFMARATGSVANLDLRQLLVLPEGVAESGPATPPPPGVDSDRHTASAALSRAVRGLPATDLTGQFEADLRGDSLADLTGTLALALARSHVDSVRVHDGRATLRFLGGAVRADTLVVASSLGTLNASGGLGLGTGRRDSLRFSVTVDSLGGLRRYLAPASGAVPDGGGAADSLAGTVAVAGTLVGSVDSLDVRGRLTGGGIVVGTTGAHAARGAFELFDLRHMPHGFVRVEADTLSLAGVALRRAGIDAVVVNRTNGRLSLFAESQSGPSIAVAAGVARRADTTAVALDTLTLVASGDRWSLDRPATVWTSPAGTSLDTLLLRGTLGGRIALGGALPVTAPLSLFVRADSVPLADLSALAQSKVPYSGRLALDLAVRGTRERPAMEWRASLAEARFGGLTLDRLTAVGGYADRRADLTLDLYRGGHPVLSARGTLPLDLSLTPVARRVLEDEPLVASVRTDSTDLSVLEALTPAVQRASGRLEAMVDVAGTWKRPRFTGTFTIGDGTMFLPNVGVRFDRVNADVALSGDSVAIRRVEASTSGQRPGRATLTGAVTFNELASPVLDLRLSARNFHVIDVPRVADLEVSTVGSEPLHLAGSKRGSVLTGGVAVTYGNIRIPDIADQKKVVSLDDPEFYQVVDTSLFTNRVLVPDAPPEFVRNLSVSDVRIDMGSDTWLRSAEANVNLGGSVRVTTSHNAREPDKVQLALGGTLRAERGTYRLNLGIVQRTFTIEGGTLRFFDTDPDLNPTLDIRAVHVVRPVGQAASQTAEREIPIRVTIGGTLAQPTLTLSSDDSRLQQSDLLSYLITGQPSFEVGTATETQSIVQLVLPSFTSYLESRFAGGLFDYVQIQSAGLGPQTSDASRKEQFGTLLGNTRLGLGWQVGSRTFVSLNVGLCQFGNVVGGTSSQFNADDLARSAGGRVEYQLSPRAGLSGALSLEPATNRLYCQQSTSRSFVPTPYQLGFDLFKRWEF